MSLVIAVVGGGAAGFFAAISAAESGRGNRVVLLEKSSKLLSKVRISGGGRCNVTHACFEPRELVTRYPRGARELLGPFHVWQPRHTIEWFESHGVELKTEVDGRMFPVTDSSQTIIDCLELAAADAGVSVRTGTGLKAMSVDDNGSFTLTLEDGERLRADRVILATGGGKSSGGLALAQKLGHTVTELAPSLFTFHIDDTRLAGLAGLSVEHVQVGCPGLKLVQDGPLLVTHWGLSGPAVLKLSAWGARDLAAANYHFELVVNWLGHGNADTVASQIEKHRQSNGKKMTGSISPFPLPRRIWDRLVQAAGIAPDIQWARLNKTQIRQLGGILTDSRFKVTGKSMNKEEFVTCGGVNLKEVDFRTMESRIVPGLYFAGEVLDIDGVTGGFNFQAAWTTGRIAGISAASQ